LGCSISRDVGIKRDFPFNCFSPKRWGHGPEQGVSLLDSQEPPLLLLAPGQCAGAVASCGAWQESKAGVLEVEG